MATVLIKKTLHYMHKIVDWSLLMVGTELCNCLSSEINLSFVWFLNYCTSIPYYRRNKWQMKMIRAEVEYLNVRFRHQAGTRRSSNCQNFILINSKGLHDGALQVVEIKKLTVQFVEISRRDKRKLRRMCINYQSTWFYSYTLAVANRYLIPLTLRWCGSLLSLNCIIIPY